ncbi:phosphotransferase [Neobacillus vireti]|uniref:Aminoglycoside phosphotransferase n=1 Tax=Neobacillus vireti LMG 21834 TaxID=1131730 RepID=A0AB94IGZ2_9BACI|nr:phosphotransferase [Neobacillus vireti]ETI66380.1 aminoglycoside phosphotransferase [Neobacillus vireti LMG 21834]
MKATNASMNQKGDDDYLNRLFSYFQSQFYEKIIQLVPIRKSVFILKTVKNTYIVKGYQTNRRLKLQEAFTATLRKEGFNKTYQYLTSPVRAQLFFEGTYFGCMEYITPHKTAFSFHTQNDRQEGMALLDQFHKATASFEARYRTLLPKGNLIEKWTERFTLFSNNLPFLKYFINEPFISEMVSWANWSLDGMEKNKDFFQKKPFVILHGDVAHHNFLRDEHGKLNLLDYDLISIGTPALDYLQYANRILPYIDWSFEKLKIFKPMQQYLEDDAFLYALVFPADIFREWNRLIREKTFTDEVKFRQVMELSIGQFYSRKKFIDRLINQVN